MTYKNLFYIIFKRAFLFTILLGFNIYFLKAQDSLLVKGVVLSNTGIPVPNVSVNIDGSYQQPVVTNDSGEFTIKSATGNEWLAVTPTGNYKEKRLFLNSRVDLKIFLTSSDLFAGDDNITILGQPVQRRNLVSTHAEPHIEDMRHSSTVSFDQYMQGRIAGVHVVNSCGDQGSPAMVSIRGIRSINTTSQPLYIVDGVPVVSQGVFNSNLEGYNYNQLSTINPFDISKITVIKDPALTTVYGTNGSNGVILIETLDPKSTETTVDVDFRSGVSLSPSNLIPQLDGPQHRTLMQEVLYSSGLNEEDIKKNYPTLFLSQEDDGYINYQHNTNWQKLIFNNSRSSNINVIIQGGDEIARYGLSFGYTNDKGIIKSTDLQGYNLRFVGRVNILEWLKLNAGLSLNYSAADLKAAATSPETSPIMASLAKSPLLGPYQYDLDGNRLTTLAEVDPIGVSNPQAIIENYSAQNHNYNFTAYADFEGIINKNMSIKTKVALTYNVLKENIFLPNHGMQPYYNGEVWNVSKNSNNNIQTFYNNTYLSVDKTFDKSHHLTSNAGFNLQTNQYQLDLGLSKNASKNDKYRALGQGPVNLWEVGGQNRNWNRLTAYENLFYSFKDRYLFTGSVSLDMSSRLGENAINTVKLSGVPFGVFYSGGVAWRLSNEAFLKNVSWIEDLKIRISAGKTGNDDIGESSASNYYQAIKFNQTTGIFPAVIPNESLSYETVNQINGGIDISLWGNRFTANVDVFQSNTDNMFVYRPVDGYLGYYFRAENGGSLTNKGWEINTFFRVMDKKSFKWDMSFNLSSVKNKVTAILGDKPLVTPVEGGEIVNMVGTPANSFYGYIYKGVYKDQQEASDANLVNNKSYSYQAGDAIFEDISGPNGIPDSVINDYDKTVIGSALPKYFGGIVNTFTYKRWRLNTFLQFVTGYDVFNYVRFKNEQMSGLQNQSQNVLNRWQFEGQVTDVPRALWNDYTGNGAFSTRWIEDGSYLRVKSITLSYIIPDKFLTLRNAEFYVSVYNIVTFTKYLGYDPEFAYSFSQRNQGIDYGQTPQPRQFIAGIKIGL
jgi:TonB-linked SusC/RagA family outer membrane protein